MSSISIDSETKDVSSLKELSRRDFLGVSFTAALGGLLTNLGFRELFSNLSEARIEFKLQEVLRNNLVVPDEWTCKLSESELDNPDYVSPLEVLSEAIGGYRSKAFYDKQFPLIISNEELTDFYKSTRIELGQIHDTEGVPSLDQVMISASTVLNSSKLFEKASGLTELMSDMNFITYGDVVRQYAIQQKTPTWSTFSRIFDAMSEESKRTLEDDVKLITDVDFFDISEKPAIFDDFVYHHKQEYRRVGNSLQQLQTYKVESGNGNKLSVAEYLKYFISQDDGDVMRGLVDAIQYARTTTRTTYVTMGDIERIGVGTDDQWTTDHVFQLSNMLEDNLSLILPWDYLASNPDLYFPIADVADHPAKWGDTPEVNKKMNLKEFHLRNRIGALAHVLSILLMCGCMDSTAVVGNIMSGYYQVDVAKVVGNNDGAKNMDTVKKLLNDPEQYIIEQIIDSTDSAVLADHGKIKFTADMMALVQAKSICGMILKC